MPHSQLQSAGFPSESTATTAKRDACVPFVYVGTHPSTDGRWIHVDSALLRRSLNYDLVRRGLVYPLFYDTLYHDLRETLRTAAVNAINRGDGIWSFDWSNAWVSIGTQQPVEEDYNIYPKIFRRITDFHNDVETGRYAGSFAAWLDAASENDEGGLDPARVSGTARTSTTSWRSAPIASG